MSMPHWLRRILDYHGVPYREHHHVQILLHPFDGPVAIGLVDPDSPGRADAMRLQEEHDSAHRLLLLPALPDALNPARAEPLHLLQEGRTLVDDSQRLVAKDSDDLAREVRPNPLDQSGTEVTLDRLGRLWRRGFDLLGLELQTVFAVMDPG